MKNFARSKNSPSVACSSMLPLDQTADTDSALAQRSHDLFLAHAEIKQLRHKQAQLEAALSESCRQRDAFAAELRMLQQQTGHYTSAEVLSVLRSTVQKREDEVKRLKDAGETDRLVLIDAVRKVLRRARTSEQAQPLLDRLVPVQFEEQLSTDSPIKAAVTMLRFTEALLTRSDSDQVARVSQLGQEIQATLQRSNQLLRTPKRELLSRKHSQDKLDQPLVRSKTRVSICKPKAEQELRGEWRVGETPSVTTLVNM